jgi:murein DD-endopeptidase MepM/ murein hydrolase activator NlpD
MRKTITWILFISLSVASYALLNYAFNLGKISTTLAQAKVQPAVVLPVKDFYNRVTKKHFGQYITQKNSPVKPERFRGYHTGADAETTKAEQKIDVPVYAIANGQVLYVGYVNGYGGVVVIKHTVGKEVVTALYGHVRLSSVKLRKNSKVIAGQKIAVLGTGYSSETNGERKHLHFGLLKGTVINFKGYVQSKSQLSAWLDPVVWLKAHGAVAPVM